MTRKSPNFPRDPRLRPLPQLSSSTRRPSTSRSCSPRWRSPRSTAACRFRRTRDMNRNGRH